MQRDDQQVSSIEEIEVTTVENKKRVLQKHLKREKNVC